MSPRLPRLFSAIWPDAAAVAALDEQLRADPEWPPPGWREPPRGQWHITVRFHGPADPDALAERLDRGAAGCPAPRLRLAGLVRFPGVCAVGVEAASPADAAALAALVTSAGGDPAEYRAHLTLARGGRRAGPAGPTSRLRTHRGPWWCADRLCLVRSDLGAGGPRYTVLHRVRLTGGGTRPSGGTPSEQARPWGDGGAW